MSTGAQKSKQCPDDDHVEDANRPSSQSVYSEHDGGRSRQLSEVTELLAHAEKIGGLGTWDLDIASRQMTFSENLCDLLGYPHGTQIHEDEYWELVNPTDREEACQIVALALRACMPYAYVARMRNVDGSGHCHLMSGLPVSGKSEKVERVIGLYRDVTNEVRSEDELHKLSQQLMRTRDDERRHMARELHESAGQTLAALKMTLGRLQEEIPQDRETSHALLRSSRELADAAVREVRTVSYLMHPPMLDEAGLYSALRWYARGFAERSQIKVDVEISEDIGRHSQEIETTIFRVVQEALTNVHRYSGSRTAAISVKREPESICVVIQDAGCGISLVGPAGQGQMTPGVGIAGMRERVMELKGTFQVESVPGRGTTIRAVLPLESSAEAAVKDSTQKTNRRMAQTNDQ